MIDLGQAVLFAVVGVVMLVAKHTGGTRYFDGLPALWSPDGTKIVFQTAPVNFGLDTNTDLKHVLMKSLPPALQ